MKFPWTKNREKLEALAYELDVLKLDLAPTIERAKANAARLDRHYEQLQGLTARLHRHYERLQALEEYFCIRWEPEHTEAGKYIPVKKGKK